MSYDTIERSAAAGSPDELYEFTFTGRSYRYTSGDEPYTDSGFTFSPVAISRSSVSPAVTNEKGGLTITLPIGVGLAEIFRVAPPSEEVALTIYRYHRGDGIRRTIWSGRVLNARFTEYAIELVLESVMSAVQRSILTRKYQRNCPYLVYGAGCHADPLLFRKLGNVVSITGNQVVLPITPTDDYYAGGELIYSNTITGISDSRFIVSNSGGTIVLDRYPYGLLAGMSVEVRPGCNGTRGNCKNKFNNQLNYGGQPNIPDKNPVGGSSIY